MTIDEIRDTLVKDDSYRFLYDDKNLGKNIILLGMGGSYSYGTNTETSDIDIRGIAVRNVKDILCGYDFEQVVETNTDTTVYSFDKMVKLLKNCNPNTIEILGLKPEHYLRMTEAGKMLVDNRKLFLSKKAVHTFGGYATSQLRRLENKSARLVSQSKQEEHILESIRNAQYSFKNRYFGDINGGIKLYVDKAVQPGYDSEIFMDVNLEHYPLRDYADAWNEMRAIVRSYSKIGKRNDRAIEHGKLGKHMMHLVRLYMMCLDILEKEEIITYREEEHELLMDIRNEKYLDDNRQPISEFYEMVDDFEKKLRYAAENTSLPELPNTKEIDELVSTINMGVIAKSELKE